MVHSPYHHHRIHRGNVLYSSSVNNAVMVGSHFLLIVKRLLMNRCCTTGEIYTFLHFHRVVL